MRNLALLGFLLLVGCDQPSDTAMENTPQITATTTRMASWPAEKFFSIVEGTPECGADESPYYWRADVAFTETKLRERSEKDLATDPPLDEFFYAPTTGREARVMFGCLSRDFAVEGVTVGVPEGDNGERRLWIQWTSTAVSEASFEGLAPSLVPAADKCPEGTDKFTITAFYRQVAGGTAEAGKKAGAFWGCRSTALEIQGIAPIT